ncbi:hypothetical protein BJ741DRAFT_587156 [Chytriomyces cf. hyalinus JEL632]|nr:hypothetical protein BJ741DRAFT_587156 [Chytriomyces cf. hyalinus JEL632]
MQFSAGVLFCFAFGPATCAIKPHRGRYFQLGFQSGELLCLRMDSVWQLKKSLASFPFVRPFIHHKHWNRSQAANAARESGEFHLA